MLKSWVALAAGAIALIMTSSLPLAAAGDPRVGRGYAIAPVPLNLAGKNRYLVGLGSYIVNAQGGCNDCHTFPNYAEGGDPFLGEPEQINTDGYLCGGRPFGPDLVSANISPDENGNPAGLGMNQFIRLLQTGTEENGDLLQVMPWPIYGKMVRLDLVAVYTYLRAIPSCGD